MTEHLGHDKNHPIQNPLGMPVMAKVKRRSKVTLVSYQLTFQGIDRAVLSHS